MGSVASGHSGNTLSADFSREVTKPQLVISIELCNCKLRYKALETTFYVVIALLPSLAVYEMVRNNDFEYLKFLTSFFDPEILMS